MSKYQELCQLFETEVRSFYAHKDESIDFARALVHGVADSLGVPRENWQVLPKDPDPDRRYTIAGALHLGGDTYWHLYLEIEITYQPFVFRFMFKKQDAVFNVKMFPNGPEYSINPQSEEDWSEFYEYVFQEIRDLLDGFYTTRLFQPPEDEGATKHPIGFQFPTQE